MMKNKKRTFISWLKEVSRWFAYVICANFLLDLFREAAAKHWNVGGEILFIPFLIMICWLWYSIGKDQAATGQYQRGKVDGYHQGTHDIAAAMEERHHETEELWARPDI